MIKGVVDSIYSGLWILLQLLILIGTDILQWLSYARSQLLQKLLCSPKYSTEGEIASVTNFTKNLDKRPKHVAFLISPQIHFKSKGSMVVSYLKILYTCVRSSHNLNLDNSRLHLGEVKNTIDFQALSKLVSWAWAANISLISLYDLNGIIKKNNSEFLYFLKEELSTSLWAFKNNNEKSLEVPRVKFYNCPQKFRKISSSNNGLNGFKNENAIHILLLSEEDGKLNLIKNAKGLIRSKIESCDRGIETIQEREIEINKSLNRSLDYFPSDPDVLVVSGNILSTLGFLPWQIRLSEIYWVPELSYVKAADFLKVLATYSGCQQRFGR